MKNLMSISCVIALAGCASQGVVNSYANENGLYDESVATLKTVIEGRDYCSDIQPINSRPFQSAKASELPENLVAEEIWVVEQCGIRKEYQLSYTKNETSDVIIGVKLHR